MTMSEEVSEAEIRQLWPLHLLVWKDDHKALDRILQEKQVGRSDDMARPYVLYVHSSPYDAYMYT